MDEQSGEPKDKEVVKEIEELLPEWGWRKYTGSWFQRQGEAQRKAQL